MGKNFDYEMFAKNMSANDYLKLQEITNPEKRKKLVKKVPYVLPLVLKSWNDEDLHNLIMLGIEKSKDFNLLTALKDREGFEVLPEYVNQSVKTNPQFVFDLTDAEKALVTKETLIEAFEKDCSVINSDCPELKKRSVLITFTKKENGVEVIKERRESLRAQLLRALRLAVGVSTPSNKGYDDFALPIARQIVKNQGVKKIEKLYNIKELMNESPTVMNALIKKQHQMVRLCKGKALRMNNNKVLNAMLREEAKQGSKLKGIHNDLPKNAVSEKAFERAMVRAIKSNFEFFYELEYEYQSKLVYQVAYLKAVRDAKYLPKGVKEEMIDEFFAAFEPELDMRPVQIAFNRSNGAKKAAKTRKTKQNQEEAR